MEDRYKAAMANAVKTIKSQKEYIGEYPIVHAAGYAHVWLLHPSHLSWRTRANIRAAELEAKLSTAEKKLGTAEKRLRELESGAGGGKSDEPNSKRIKLEDEKKEAGAPDKQQTVCQFSSLILLALLCFPRIDLD